MPIGTALQAARRLASTPVRRRAALVASLALVERLALPGAVLLAAPHPRGAAGLVALASAIVVIRGVAQRRHAVLGESELFIQAGEAALLADPYPADMLPDAEARANLFAAANRVAVTLAETIPNTLASGVAVLFVCPVIGFVVPPIVTLVAAAATILAVTLVLAMRGNVARTQTSAWDAWARMSDAVTDALEGRLEVVGLGREDQQSRALRHAASTWSARARLASRVTALSGRLPLLVVGAAVAGAVGIGALASGEPWSEASHTALLLAAVAPLFVSLARGLQDISLNDARMHVMLQLIVRPMRLASHASPLPRPGAVECRNVTFAYGAGMPPVLTDLSFAWRNGRILAIAGPNGSGKTTCLRMLLGLGVRSDGTVLADGQPLEGSTVEQWRRSLAYLPQRPYLPQRSSVRQSIGFLFPEASEDDMIASLSRVEILERLRSLGGRDPLGVVVDALSIGERQRVALARLLCSPNKSAVLLDEPDANLDRAGLALVASILRELAINGLVLFTAHSSELLQIADDTVNLDLPGCAKESRLDSH